MRRAIGIVVITVLSWAPAVSMACAALCKPSMDHGGKTMGAHEGHSGPPMGTLESSSKSVTVATSHHHAVSDHRDAARAAFMSPQLTGVDHNCCAESQIVLTAAVAALRADVGTPLMAAAPTVATLVYSLPSMKSTPGDSPPTARPSPARSPLVLRI